MKATFRLVIDLASLGGEYNFHAVDCVTILNSLILFGLSRVNFIHFLARSLSKVQ